jgi:hypothetical protein
MVGAFDQVVSVAAPALATSIPVVVAPAARILDPSPAPRPASPSFVPETPPPIVA